MHEDGVVPVPTHLSDVEAATLPCAALTAWHALVASAGIKAGETVLIQGTGGVSLFSLQFAKLHGARVVATSSSKDKLARVLKMGASDGINYKETPEWGDKVRELSGSGVDHVVEVGGAGTLGQSLRAVKVGGHIAMIGVLTGAGETGVTPILMKNVRVQGIYVGSRDKILYALRDQGSSATRVFSITFPGEVQSSPAIGANGSLYVTPITGFLYSYSP